MQNHRQFARQTLRYLSDYIEQNIISLEIEPNDEDLLIIDNQNRHFLLNYHGVTHQIWYSSAVSGAHHFSLQDNGVWQCTRSQRRLFDVLSTELGMITSQEIHIPHA
ncbi:MAG: hypothetical protein KF820_04110 [Candidatus Paracaedibacteraceae bacterium]|jgi:CyaY protein|nr:hypothetical protein [Candidatus Paracaedibacteraceae bacterium]